MDSFFGIGMFELVMIAIIALVVLGPERLPGAMREMAKYAKQLRKVSNEFQSQFSEELKVLDELNPRRIINEVLDPNVKPAPPPARTGKPVAPAAPVVAVKPPIPNAETANAILPPPVLSLPAEPPTVADDPVGPGGASDPGSASSIESNVAAQSADHGDNGAEAAR